MGYVVDWRDFKSALKYIEQSQHKAQFKRLEDLED